MEEKIKKGSLHGDVPMENKAEGASNAHDAGDDMAEKTRKAEVLHYLKPDSIEGELSEMGKEFIVHTEVDQLYPGNAD